MGKGKSERGVSLIHLHHKPAVVVRVTGGVGNQLFQFAAGVALAERLGGRLLLDIEAFATDPLRRYRLNQLRNPPQVLSKRELSRLLEPGWIKRNVFRRRGLRVVQHHQASFRPDVLEVDEACYLDGYWQSLRYFESAKEIIRQKVEFPRELPAVNGLLGQARSERIASVHIRRGDYANVNALRDWHGVLPIRHYFESLQLLDARFGLEGVFVFTDDPEWVGQNFQPDLPLTIVSTLSSDELDDLAVMRSCRYHVLANSSFSWWGAWLSDARPDAIVAPRRWFATTAEDSSAIVPPGWALV